MNLGDPSDYKNFKDFCEKNHLTPRQGIEILEQELIKLGAIK